MRVAVTTSHDGVQRVAEVLRRSGLEPVPLPCLRLVPAPDRVIASARGAAQEADWILLTSRRTVEVVWPDGAMPPAPIAAVGPATASVAARAGGRVELVGTGGSGPLVAELVPRVGRGTVVFPHAAGAGPAAVAHLERAGARVLAFPVYRMQPVAPEADPVDAVVFASPSAVKGWLSGRNLDGVVIAAIGETTAAALRARGHRPMVQAEQPSIESLAAALTRHLSERKQR